MNLGAKKPVHIVHMETGTAARSCASSDPLAHRIQLQTPILIPQGLLIALACALHAKVPNVSLWIDALNHLRLRNG
jgi:hypothetical protein